MKFFIFRNKILSVAILVAVVLSLNFFQQDIKGFFYSVSRSFQKTLWLAGDETADFLGSIFRVESLKKENEEMSFKIQELVFLQSSMQELEKENKSLREALGLGLQKEFKLELAEIIGKDINQDSILIDKGIEDGVEKGMPLVTSQKVLIGNIAEVYRGYSRVLLISDKKSQLQAEISGTNISGLLKGSGNFKILLDLIPREEELKNGDLVIFRGFLVGLVKEVKKVDVDPFQQAEISPFFDISNLDKAFIVLNF
ncbi:MAG: rod shape-determining protein MreC [bacterium]|nr:rod shape-determining protein MreC [bacterium]